MKLKEEKKEMSLGDVSYEIFYELMLFIYTCELPNRMEDKAFVHLLKEAAHRFGVQSLLIAIMNENSKAGCSKVVSRDLVEETVSPLSPIQGRFNLVFNSDAFSDITFIFENGRKIFAHKVEEDLLLSN